MKLFFVLLVCLSLAIAIIANDDEKKNNSTERKSCLNALDPFSIPDNDKCSFCYQTFDVLHIDFQDPFKKLIFAEIAKEECLDEECRQKVDAFVESVAYNTDVDEACKVVCVN